MLSKICILCDNLCRLVGLCLKSHIKNLVLCFNSLTLYQTFEMYFVSIC